MKLNAMRKTPIAAAAMAGGLAWILILAAAPVSGQSADFEPPRLSNGNPDLNGIWQALGAAHYDIEPHTARSAMQLREGPQGPLPDVPVLRLGAVGAVPGSMGIIEGGGTIPYTEEARALKDENHANWLDRDPVIKCYMPGVPRATYMPFPFQIFQNENNVFIAYEFAGAVRDIYLMDVGPAETDSWMGQSVGRWEGDTLVVEVTGQNDQTWFDRAGSHHTNQLRVVERYNDDRPAPHPVRGDDGRPERLHAPVDRPPAALPPHRRGRAADGLQVRGVRRGAALRRVPAQPAAALAARA